MTVNLLLIAFYVGPDQMMPVASILATVMGFVMIFWNKLLGIVRKIFGRSKPVEAEENAPQTPKDQPK
ncbi:MAG: hypothetical protein M1453_09055 [Acidobacteria bacterium]|nr:hypothetical protein [Acidobacteriota bacterium]MCL5288123.1 hypothetical protein [Acidobacteriota bacterium]